MKRTGTDDELLSCFVGQGDTDAFEALYEKYKRLVYSVCLRCLKSSADAEDAALACFVALHEKAGTIKSGGKLASWLYSSAVRISSTLLRSRRRSMERETEVYLMNENADDPGKVEWCTMLSFVEQHIDALPDDQREVLVLRYYMSRSIPEISEDLRCRESTVSGRLQRAIGNLRAKVGKSMPEAREAAIEACLSSPALLVAAPGGMSVRFLEFAASGKISEAVSDLARQFVRSLSAGRVRNTAVRVSVVLALLGAGWGILAAAGRLNVDSVATVEKPVAAATNTNSKFDIPAWHPDARWEVAKESFANNTKLPGILDGPRQETLQFSVTRPHLLGGFVGSGRYVFQSYDARTERFHPATRGARGMLDGPFSRARFNYDDYHASHMQVRGQDGRFYYIPDWYSGSIRVLDFAKQMVSTLAVKGPAVSADGESGRIYVLNDWNPITTLTVLSPGPEWKVLETKSLQGKQTGNALGLVLAVDEKRNRLYGRTAYPNNPWYVWYWDLGDGSYHGLLPISPKDAPGKRRQGEAGPFSGTVLYGHGELCWGPDDPDKRHLYLANVDDGALYRMDLDKEVLMVMNKDGRFSDRGMGIMAAYSRSPLWFDDGSFVGSYGTYPGIFVTYFRRIK
ncbi:MAG: hypothetical protein C0404_08420 [Verrucomicrobia bacterium]|nr:hypothetical protein [Verrucomicrobiota bacterium]